MTKGTRSCFLSTLYSHCFLHKPSDGLPRLDLGFTSPTTAAFLGLSSDLPALLVIESLKDRGWCELCVIREALFRKQA